MLLLSVLYLNSFFVHKTMFNLSPTENVAKWLTRGEFFETGICQHMIKWLTRLLKNWNIHILDTRANNLYTLSWEMCFTFQCNNVTMHLTLKRIISATALFHFSNATGYTRFLGGKVRKIIDNLNEWKTVTSQSQTFLSKVKKCFRI